MGRMAGGSDVLTAREIELLELIVPFKEYLEAREVYKQLKPQHKEKARAFKRLQRRHGPFVDVMKYVTVS